jgi:murein DD-endopeptidase MepM/ murein hydrolase activator NlpD
MKRTILISLMSLICMPAAHAEDDILCIKSPTTRIYDKDLKKVILSGRQHETVVQFQGYGQKETATYVRVELTDREEEEADNNVGWIDKNLIKPKSKCAGYKVPVIETDNNDPAVKDAFEDATNLQATTGLSLNCCLFPMKKHPTHSMNEGMRRFGAGRSKGARLHAAADLYQTQYQPVYAIAQGKVLRDRVPFYLGTNVTEIEHPGGFIARYGEMASESLKPLKVGDTVEAGQLIGYIKKVNSRNVKNPMLHFELYTGKGSGPLTVEKRGNKFQRRSDLINPTQYLAQWEKNL